MSKNVQIPEELFDALVMHFFKGEDHTETIKKMLMQKVVKIVKRDHYSEGLKNKETAPK